MTKARELLLAPHGGPRHHPIMSGQIRTVKKGRPVLTLLPTLALTRKYLKV